MDKNQENEVIALRSVDYAPENPFRNDEETETYSGLQPMSVKSVQSRVKKVSKPSGDREPPRVVVWSKTDLSLFSFSVKYKQLCEEYKVII